MRILILLVYSVFFGMGCSQKPITPIKPASIEKNKLYKRFDTPFEEGASNKTSSEKVKETFTLENGLLCTLLPEAKASYVHIKLVVRHNKFRNKYFDRLIAQLLKIHSVRNQSGVNLSYDFYYETLSDYSTISISTLEQDTPAGLQSVFHQLSTPTWTNADFEHAKLLTSFERKLNQNLSSQLLYKSFKALILGSSHHYNDPRQENAEVSLSQIQSYFTEHYRPENALLIISGRIEPSKISADVKNSFASWKLKGKKQVEPTTTPSSLKNKISTENDTIYLIHKTGAQQVNIITGFRSVARSHPDWFGLHFSSVLLGGGSHSRLFTDIRERRGLSYSIWSRQTQLKDAGLFYIQTSTAHEKVAAIITGILQHREHLINELVDQEELALHQNFLLGQQVFRNESLEDRAETVAREHILALEANSQEVYLNSIRELDSKSLQEQVLRYFTQPWTTVLVGDAEHIRPQLETYFPGIELRFLEPDTLF